MTLSNGDKVMPDPILIGRNAEKMQALAKTHNIERWGTDLDAALANPDDTVFFDAGTTQMRPTLLAKAIRAGKHVYCEKPIATNLNEAVEIARLAQEASARSGIKHGAVQDKLFLPGLRKLDMLRRAGFFGNMLSLRLEFGYWVFEGDLQPIQRPSWNYRSEDGGGMILDMMCHWRYVLDNLFGEVKSITCLGATHIPQRWDEAGKPYAATADDAAYAIAELVGHNGEPVVAQLNMSWATRVNREDLRPSKGWHARLGRGDADRLQGAKPREHAAPGVEPGRTPDHEVHRPVVWTCPTRRSMTTASRSSGSISSATWRKMHPSLQVDTARRRQGRAAGGSRAAELERTSLGGRTGPESLRRIQWPCRSTSRSLMERCLRTRCTPPCARLRHPVQPHRLFGCARGGRPACSHRPLAAMRGGLGRHHRLPPLPVVAGPGRCRSHGHRTARHGAGLAHVAGAHPPLARAAITCPAHSWPAAAAPTTWRPRTRARWTM